MRFWDTSAIVPLVLEESSTLTAKTLFNEDSELLVWWASRVEASSSLARSIREGRLKPEQLEGVLGRLDRMWQKVSIIEPEPAILVEAQRLLFKHLLRASDALQLAAAAAIVDRRPDDLAIVTLDHRLKAAAEAEGFTVYPTSLVPLKMTLPKE